MTPNIKSNKSNQKELLLSAGEIAKYFLSLDPQRKQFRGEKAQKLSGIAVPTIGNFRLNKLLHISQMLYAAKYGKWLFSDSMLAFEHGGIVYDVYRRFHFLVKQSDNASDNLTASHRKFLDKIFNHFQSYNNEELEEFVHDDPAWKKGWDGKSTKQMRKSQALLNYYQRFASHIVEKLEL